MAPIDRPAYGTRAQVTALRRNLDDVEGNRDGVPNNERPSSPLGHLLEKAAQNPLVNKALSTFEPGLSTKDEERRISAFVSAREQRWGRPTTALTAKDVPDLERFRAEKALALARFGRDPSQVTERFVEAKGSVDGQKIADRKVFTQTWAPIGTPSGKTVVISPGFQETGRNFYEQIDLLNRQGHEVVVMDHPWAGYTQGDKGGIDRGYGIARDVASVAAQAAVGNEKKYGQVAGHEVVLMGNSMGAGPGVLGALALNDAGKISLSGPPMPKGLNAILQAPFLDTTPSALNKLLTATSHVPLLKDQELPSTGLPVLTRDPAAAAKFANHAAAEKIVARPQAMSAATADLEAIRKLVASGQGPTGRIYVIHGDQDPLASPKAAQDLARTLGSRAHLDLIASPNHILEESPSEQRHILDGMAWLASGR